MKDWKKEILANRNRKRKEKEDRKQEDLKRKADEEAKRQEAISFICDKVVPAFKRARKDLEDNELGMRASYPEPQGDTSIEMEVKPRITTRPNYGTFRYRVEMEYNSSSVIPYAVCFPGEKYKIEKTNDHPERPTISNEFVTITEDDIYHDLMKHFYEYDDQHHEDDTPSKLGLVKKV